MLLRNSPVIRKYHFHRNCFFISPRARSRILRGLSRRSPSENFSALASFAYRIVRKSARARRGGAFRNSRPRRVIGPARPGKFKSRETHPRAEVFIGISSSRSATAAFLRVYALWRGVFLHARGAFYHCARGERCVRL